MADFDAYDGMVAGIYLQPPSEGVQECVVIDMVAGPKQYVRYWPASHKLEWGWSLHPTAIKVWEANRG